MKDERKPIGWPENVPLPTKEKVAEVLRKEEELIVKMRKDLEGKISGPTAGMLNTIITI